MILKLEKLILKNFKGIKDLEIDFGQTTEIYGANATGKTTVFDAFTWLLFNKNSAGNTDFGIKTKDENGIEVHNLEHSVEGYFTVDGQPLTLRKVYTEKWTQKRGTATAEFTGHETTYFVNDVPKKKSEYTVRISSLISEDVFKIVTNPLFANEKMKWQDLRALLLSVSGDIADSDILASDSNFADLVDKLQGRTVAEVKKMTATKQAAINDELKKIPVQINEAKLAMPEVAEIDRALKDSLQAQAETLKNAISNASESTQINDLLKMKIKLQGDYTTVSTSKADVTAENSKIKEFQTEKDSATRRYNLLKSELDGLNYSLENCKNNLKKCADDWYIENAKAFTGDNICPTCGQELPPEQYEKTVADFNLAKAERLELLEQKGNGFRTAKANIEENIAKTNEQLEDVKGEIRGFEDVLTMVEKDRDRKIKDFENGKVAELKYIAGQIEHLEKEIKTIESGTSDIAAPYKEQLQAVENQLADIRRAEANNTLIERQQARIIELEQKEKALAIEYSNLEKTLFLAEEFTRKKVNLLTDKINALFQYAKFKLFNEQINGGLQECCEVTFNGVPYSDLNNAGKINIGLDIINTLCRYHNITAPIFIDNAESVTDILHTESQQVRLIVSAEHKKLNVAK